MAIFLLGGLLVSSSVIGSGKQGILGGPDPIKASEIPNLVDASGVLYSQNMRMDVGPSLSFPETPILSATLVSNPIQPDNSTPPQSSDAQAILAAKSLPSLKGYFSMPAAGLNWGILHDNNAVDIANACGTPVYSAAEGVVVPDPSIQDDGTGWNGGYGNFVLIEHPNGVKTRYAHLQQILVKIGDYVSKKQEIGLMGSTGRATGCHVHFEVLGAKNLFAK